MKKLIFYLLLLISINVSAQIPSYLPQDSLKLWWPFNGNINDNSGNNYTIKSNAVILSADRFGNQNSACLFNGTSSYISTDSAIFSGQIPFSCSFWAKSSNNSSMDIIGKSCQTDCGTDMRIMLNTGQCNQEGISFKSPAFFATSPFHTADTAWHHYVVVYGNNNNYSYNNIQFYIDGEYQEWLASNCGHNWGGWTYNAPALPFILGKSGANSNYYNGFLDDVGVWKRALTKKEIEALFSNCISKPNVKAFNYCKNQQVSPLSILPGQGNQIVWFDANKNQLLQPPTPNTASTANTFYYVAQKKISTNCLSPLEKVNVVVGSCQSVPSNIPTMNLVAWYPFNKNAQDESGNLKHGNTRNVILTNDRNGNSNSAYLFNGNSSWIQIDTAVLVGQTPATFSFWAKTEKNSSMDVLSQACGSDCGTDMRIMLNTAQCNQEGLSFKSPAHFATYPYHTADTSWHNYVMVFGSNNNYSYNNIKFYRDGIENVSSNYCGHNWGGWTYSFPNIPLSIGKAQPLGGVFNGIIDDIAIWNRALTQTEITSIANTPISLSVISQIDTISFPSQTTIAINSNAVNTKNIIAYNFKLNYNSSKFKFDSVSTINTASAGGILQVNKSVNGSVNIGWARSTKLTGTQPIINLYFTPIDSGKATFALSNAYLNADSVTTVTAKSVVTKFNFGDIDLNKKILAYDAALALQYSVGMDPLPTIDPLPWEPWRIKIASVDTSVMVNANDASLILKYSIGMITKFPKRGIASAPGYVTVNLENNELVVRSFEDMGGLNITFLDHLSDLGAPTYVHNTNALSAFNKQANMYKIAVAFSQAPVNGTVILRIPYTGLGNQTLNMELVENTATRNYQLNVVTGINDIKNSDIKIYPNPTNNIINIEGLNKNENNTIQIFDVQGKLVITKTITEKGTIDLSELNKGVYVIKIGEVAQRIVKM